MDKQEELVYKAELVKSKEYKEIRKLLLDYITEISSSVVINTERIAGMLMIIREADSWVTDLERALIKSKKDKE